MIKFAALALTIFFGVNSHANSEPSYVGKWLVTYQWSNSHDEQECEWDDENDEWICEQQPPSAPGVFELSVTENSYCAGTLPSNCHAHRWIETADGTHLSFSLAPATYSGVLKGDNITGTMDSGASGQHGSWSAVRR